MKPLLLFAPGAGAPSSHPWMQRWTVLLERIGSVTRFDYAYMQEGRKRPDPLPLLIATHQAALREARLTSDVPAVLLGKSMGGRIGCHLSLKEKAAALVCFGYPLCGGGDPARMRDKILREISAPILFIQGTRDPLCPLALLNEVRRTMVAPNELYVVEGGDHSLGITKTQLKAAGETQEAVNERILGAIGKFLVKHL